MDLEWNILPAPRNGNPTANPTITNQLSGCWVGWMCDRVVGRVCAGESHILLLTFRHQFNPKMKF